jgi:uncharacterized membrane protein YgcG
MMMTKTSRFLVAIWSAMVCAAAVLAMAPAAHAEEPLALTARVTDPARVVNNQGPVDAALARLEEERDFQLFVLYVQTTQPRAISGFVDEVVRLSNLSGRDSLLTVAARDRTYQLWVGDDVAKRVSEGEQDEVLASVERALRNGDYGGAAIAAADGLRSASDGGGASSGGGGGGGISVIIPLLLIIGLVVAGIWWLLGRKGRAKDAGQAADRSAQELAPRANQLLIEADDALQAAYQEVEFARAQFGDESVSAHTAALAEANVKLKAAFARRRGMEDGPSEGGQAAGGWAEIVALVEEARGAIELQLAGLRRLRDIEGSAPAVLEAIRRRLPELERRAEAVGQIHAGLSRYAEEVFTPVADNPRLVEEGLAQIRGEAEDAQREIDAGRPAGAVASLSNAEAAAARTAGLLDAVERLAQQIRDAEAAWQQQLAEAQHDLAAARGAINNGHDANLDAKISRAAELVSRSRQAGSRPRPDPLAALRDAEEAEALADSFLAELQQRQQEAEKLRQMASSSIRTAESAFARAADYVMSRRGGVQARTKLREAERSVEEARALIDNDPRRAVEVAQYATRQAEDAIELTSRGEMSDYGPVFGRPRGMGGLGGLGGIIFGGLGGLGRSGGGFSFPRGGGRMGGGRSRGGGFGSGGRTRGGRW